MHRKGKNLFVCLLCLMVMVMNFTGCGSSKNTEKNSNTKENAGSSVEKTSDEKTAMGAYVEEKMSLPEGFSEGRITSITVENGHLVVYAPNMVKQKDERLELQDDGTWKEEENTYVEDLRKLDGGYLSDITYGMDGNIYLTAGYFSDGKSSYKIVKVTDQGLKPLDIDTSMGGADRSYVQLVNVIDENKILFSDGSVVYCLDSKGKELFSLKTGSYYSVQDGNILFTNWDENALQIYDLDGNLKESIKSDVPLGMGVSVLNKDGVFFMGGNSLYHYNRQGSIWQNLMDGAGLAVTAMNMRSMKIISNGDKDDLYILATFDFNNYSLYHYYFDETVPSEFKEILNVYTLNNNPTIRQGIANFRQDNKDIGVNFEIADRHAERTDVIHTLNTEILAGNGPDVIILDNLPEKAYLEKGVLADITDIIQPMLDDKALFETPSKCFAKDGKYYYYPCRFQVPLIYGDKKVIDGMKSLDDMLNYLNSAEPRKDFDVDKEYIGRTFFRLFFDEIIQEDGKFNEDAFRKYLNVISILSERCDPEQSPYSMYMYPDTTLDNGFGRYVKEKDDPTTRITVIQDYFDVYMPFGAREEAGMAVESYHNQVYGYGLMGINSASKHMENARKLVQSVLSEKVQAVESKDGLTVNAKVIDQKMGPGINEDSCVGGDFNGKDIIFNRPKDEDMEEFKTLLRGLDKRHYVDETIVTLVEPSVTKFLEGTNNEDQTLQDVKNQISTYLSE